MEIGVSSDVHAVGPCSEFGIGLVGKLVQGNRESLSSSIVGEDEIEVGFKDIEAVGSFGECRVNLSVGFLPFPELSLVLLLGQRKGEREQSDEEESKSEIGRAHV